MGYYTNLKEKKAKVTNPFSIDNTTSKSYTAADSYVYNNSKRDLKKITAKIKTAEKLYQEAAVAYVIESDNHKPANTDVSRITAKIISAANYAGVSADALACIVKRESHFRENTLKGPMGINNIIIKDLYTRPQAYDEQFKKLVSKYGSVSRVFNAKKHNTLLNLGTLGNLLFKYENWKKLNQAIRTDYELNLKIGAFLYKNELDRTLTDKTVRITEKENYAFTNYYKKYSNPNYTDSAIITLKKARAAADNDIKYLSVINNKNSVTASKLAA